MSYWGDVWAKAQCLSERGKAMLTMLFIYTLIIASMLYVMIKVMGGS